MTLEAKYVKPNAFTENLKSDWIAVDTNGNVLARADNEDGARRAAPGAAAFFTGKDLDGKVHDRPLNPAPAPSSAVPGVPTTPSGLPIADALADDPTPEPSTRTHPLDDGTPFEGPAAVEPAALAASFGSKNLDGTPIKDALDASHDASVEAENAGRHAKTDELQHEQVKALEKDGIKTTPDPLDHDGNGRKGGTKAAAKAIGATKDQGGKAAASKTAPAAKK